MVTAGIGGKIASTTKIPKVNIEEKQLQHEFKHARDFGIDGNYNKQNAELFKKSLNSHISSKETLVIPGTYKGNTKGMHYFDPKTNLWLFEDQKGNYIASWKLSNKQVSYLKTRRNIQ